MTPRRNRLEQIARKLTSRQLQRSDSVGFDFGDLSLFDVGQRGSDRFLGFYSEPGLKLALTKYGLFKALAQQGFDRVHLHVDTQDPYVHRLRLDLDDGHQVLGELVVRREAMTLAGLTNTELAAHPFQMLTIEWLYLQDANRPFNSARPQLPGQDHPGLGLARMVLELLLVMGKRLNLAGLLNHPAHFHNAVMGDVVFAFIDPIAQARFDALKRDLAGYALQAASWAVHWGCVINCRSQRPFIWKADRYMVALDKRLIAYLRSADYQERQMASAGAFRFELDEAALAQKAAHSQVFIPRIAL